MGRGGGGRIFSVLPNIKTLRYPKSITITVHTGERGVNHGKGGGVQVFHILAVAILKKTAASDDAREEARGISPLVVIRVKYHDPAPLPSEKKPPQYD